MLLKCAEGLLSVASLPGHYATIGERIGGGHPDERLVFNNENFFGQWSGHCASTGLMQQRSACFACGQESLL